MSITQEDVQENFSLKIDGYPLLKKFRGEEEYTSWEFLQEMKFFSGLVFKGIVYISENRVMAEIYPLFKPKRTEETKRSLLGTLSESISSIFAYDPILEAFSNLTLEEYLENESHEKLENFIKQQLNISGIVHPSLLRQPNSPNRLIQFTFYVRDKSLRDFFFHNDHNFFNIITYFKKVIVFLILYLVLIYYLQTKVNLHITVLHIHFPTFHKLFLAFQIHLEFRNVS